MKYGQPNNKLSLGHTLTAEEKREFVMEKWIYGLIDGMYYENTLEGDKIIEINSFVQ